MNSNNTYQIPFVSLLLLFIIVLMMNLSFGSVDIPIQDIFDILFNKTSSNENWQIIITEFRIPKAITAIFGGSALAVSGLLMQTLFRNPLADPYILGISSGASLGIAILILLVSIGGFSTIFLSNWSFIIAAAIGASLIMLVVLTMAGKIKNTMSILIIGLMFGSFAAAIIGIMAYFSTANQLQQYIAWGFGNLGNHSTQELWIYFGFYIIGIIPLLFLIKPLNSLLLGENYAQSLGVNIKKVRLSILVVTSLLTGLVTAFSGPIAFVGLAVPHLTKLIFNTSNHFILIPAVLLNGAILMLISDTIAQLPNSEFTLPINAITTLFGAPIVIWLIVRKRKINY
ncbi:MAG: iron ABC transporter permease [Flavobacteriaceae bacterium]|nr:iron ABC transporter permease [Flavobacteriaceae bacterium]